MSNIYAKISVYEIKIGTLNVPLIFHQQIMAMNDSQGELVIIITQNFGKKGDISFKIRHFYKCVYYISAKIILVSSASIFVGE